MRQRAGIHPELLLDELRKLISVKPTETRQSGADPSPGGVQFGEADFDRAEVERVVIEVALVAPP